MILPSKDGLLRFAFELLPASEAGHDGWHSYALTMDRVGKDEQFSLRSTGDSPLFLSWKFDPEIEDLCVGIRSVVEEGREYTFEPIDERDFSFTIRRQGGILFVQLSVADHPVPDDLGWPHGLEVKEVELLGFASGLEAELVRVKGLS